MFFNYQGANNAQTANGGYGLFANMPNTLSYSPKWGYDDDYLEYLALSSLFGNNNTVAQSASAIPVAQGIPVYNPYAAAQINPNMLWAYDDDMFDMDDIKVIAVPGANGVQQYVIFDD